MTMDIRTHSTMIIAMAIAVVITAGVMVPVINDSLSNISGTEDSGTSVSPSDGPPVNGYWTFANESTEKTIMCRTLNDNVVIYDGDWVSDETLLPYYTATNMSTFVPVMIGETFAVVIDSSSKGNEGYSANMFVYGASGFATASEIEIDGTQITFYDSRLIEGSATTLTGLIAYLSPEGDYTSATDSFKKNGDAQIWTAVLGGNSAPVTISGTADNPEFLGNEIPPYVTPRYTTDSGMITGVEFVAEAEEEDPHTPIVSHVIQPITPTRNAEEILYSCEYPMYTSDGSEPTTFIFSVIPIDSGSGGNGSVSPTLVAIVTAIPIVVLAGLITVGIGMMRGKGA